MWENPTYAKKGLMHSFEKSTIYNKKLHCEIPFYTRHQNCNQCIVITTDLQCKIFALDLQTCHTEILTHSFTTTNTEANATGAIYDEDFGSVVPYCKAEDLTAYPVSSIKLLHYD